MSGLLSVSALGFPRQDANETAAKGEILQDFFFLLFFFFPFNGLMILFCFSGMVC